MRPKLADGKRSKHAQNRIKAMSHPVRMQVLRMLSDRGELRPADIAKEIGEPTPSVSYHLKRLVKLDCAELTRERQVKGKGAVEHFYVATERAFLDTEDWNEIEPSIGETHNDLAMQKLADDYAASRKAGVVGSDAEFHLTRTPLLLDEQGVQESMENCEEWRLRQSEIEAKSAARRAESGEPATPVSSSLAFFKMPRSK